MHTGLLSLCIVIRESFVLDVIMDKPTFKLVGAPCGQHGQYTFYKALRISGERERIIAIGDFFFVRIWQDSELVSIGELQLLWTDRVSDQTLVSLRLYFLPENTPDGRGLHGQDEVLAINDKVVIRAEDLLSWVCLGGDWRWGLRAVWRGACAPPADPRTTQALHHTRLDFSDVEREKSAISEDSDIPGVVVFSYPRYCRYRALLSRLEGIQGDWLRDSLVAALGGYAAPSRNTRILYCKDTFEYPELEGHEFVCNQLAPKLKGRPRGRRRRRARSHSPSPSCSSDSQPEEPTPPLTPRRLSLRNGPSKHSDDEDKPEESAEDRAFMSHLRRFYRERKEPFKLAHSLKDLSLRALYCGVAEAGGYEAVCRLKLWRRLHSAQPNTARRLYERFLLSLEKHEQRNGVKFQKVPNGKVDEPRTIDTIEVADSPLRDTHEKLPEIEEKRLRTPSPKLERKDNETGEVIKEELNIINKPAEELNREFLDSLPKEEKGKISVKPVEKLIEPKEEKEKEGVYLNELAHKFSLGNADKNLLNDIATAQQELVSSNALSSLCSLVNGHRDQSRPAGRSSLRAVRVKPGRAPQATAARTPPIPPLRPDSASSSPPTIPTITNFGIHHPPRVTSSNSQSDDEIVEVPYKPKTPEIIDLDEYPESPQSVKKKKLDILKERGLEVTAIPSTVPPTALPTLPPWPTPAPMLLNPVQHQIMTQAQLFQMYNMIPTYSNGLQPPKVIQATSAFGSSGPEKTVYGNPKDPFMPPPHVLHGTPVKPQKVQTSTTPPQDILDLTCKSLTPPSQKPAVEIVRIPNVASPSKNSAQNLSKNYTLVDGKAVVGSNLEITLVNPKKSKSPQKRSSNGKFVSAKTPPKEMAKFTPSPSGLQKKAPIVVPNYQISRDDISPTSSTGSRDSQSNLLQAFKGNSSLAQIMEMQKSVSSVPIMDPMYMSALYGSLAGSMDQRQLALYRDFVANQFRGYSGLLNIGAPPTTKN